MYGNGLNYGRNYDNRQYGWDTSTSPDYYVQRDSVTTYDVPHQSRKSHVVFDDNVVASDHQERRPVASSYYPDGVAVYEDHRPAVHKNHRYGTSEPRKHVHFVEHKEKITESLDDFGNKKVYKESVDLDTEAEGFINRKHKNFELTKTGTFNSYY